MAKSPRTKAQGPVEVAVASNGKELTADIVSVTVKKALNRIPGARIVLMDGDVANQDFPLSDGDDFKPGAEIEVKAGYDGNTETIFKGVVVSHRLRIDGQQGARLIVECRDKAYAMTLDRKNACHIEKLDSDVMKSLIGSYGISQTVTATTEKYAEMVQYCCSDWDYILSRAEMNGQVVIADDARLTIAAPQTSGSPVLAVTYGEDIIDFDADIDAQTRIQGVVTFQGSSLAKVGAIIELKGVGNRFDGSVYLSGVEHNISAGEWLTNAEFGLAPKWFTESDDVVASPATARMPGVAGLHIGVVKKLDEDSAKQFRVQVSIPVLGDNAEGVWARLSQFYSSNQYGAFFVPEIGDEVVLGFMNDDPSHPVILGSLYSSKLPSPYELTAGNNIKALVTRSMMKIEFDDDKKLLAIRTPAGNRLILNEEDRTITLEDQNSNTLTMSSGGIDMTSPKDTTISADGNVVIKAKGKIDVTARQDVAVAGLNVTNTAEVGFTAKGNATAELSASGQTTVKGAMVMIN